MQVVVNQRTYRMSEREYHGLLEIAKEQVRFGIYAIEKKDYAELKNDTCKSVTELKKLRRLYKSRGFKVYANED